MPTKKQLIKDTITGKLSRLKAKDLPLVGIDGLNDGDIVLFDGVSGLSGSTFTNADFAIASAISELTAPYFFNSFFEIPSIFSLDKFE